MAALAAIPFAAMKDLFGRAARSFNNQSARWLSSRKLFPLLLADGESFDSDLIYSFSLRSQAITPPMPNVLNRKKNPLLSQAMVQLISPSS